MSNKVPLMVLGSRNLNLVLVCRNSRIYKKKDFLACNRVRLELVHICGSLSGPDWLKTFEPVRTLVYEGEKFGDLYFGDEPLQPIVINKIK